MEDLSQKDDPNDSGPDTSTVEVKCNDKCNDTDKTRRLSSSLETSLSANAVTGNIGNDDSKTKLTPKVSFKARKQTYKNQKKKVAKELSSAIKDKSVIILSSWLKIRGTLKSWAKYWCVVKPEVVIIYKSDKYNHWVGTVMINNLEIIERPSSKEGFCFKLFQPYGQNIWATKGPKGELAGSLVQPMPKDHLIFRAPNEEIGRCWLDALEVAQRSSLVNTADKIQSDIYGSGSEQKIESLEGTEHVYDDGFVGDKSDYSSGEDLQDEEAYVACVGHDEVVEETPYNTPVEQEEFGESGETTEEMEEENKSILWALLKQVRPGMDLSKVTLPTFILEPRSFLDKLADYYYHSDYLAKASKEENPYLRMKEIVKWYLSGFYKKPKGLKKPYNPIIGEMFRCMWTNQDSSKTFFIAEQVSHHPPVSAFHCSNRKGGYVIGGSILAKSKFYGNSSSAILDGVGTISLLKMGEDYCVTMPYAHVKGILIGSLTAEYGGVVNIKCEKTGYNAEIEFKLKPFWKKSGESNYISGKIRMGNDVLSKIDGRWDSEIFITEYSKTTNRSGEEVLPELFFAPTAEVKKSRLCRYNVDLESQEEYESEYLWRHVSAAIKNTDQTAATNEKLTLENNQRKLHKDLKESGEEWVPRYFERNLDSSSEHAWVYKYKDVRPWDPQTDLMQFEEKGVIKTQTKHRVPLVKRTSSSPNIFNNNTVIDKSNAARLPSIQEPLDAYARRPSYDRSSNGSTRSVDERADTPRIEMDFLTRQLKELHNEQQVTVKQITTLRLELRKYDERLSTSRNGNMLFKPRDIFIVLFVIVLQYFLQKYLFK